MTTREAFEAWAGKGLHLERIPTGAPFAGDYLSIVMQTRWDAWQAATNAALASAPAWHDAPTEPGLWLCDERRGAKLLFNITPILVPTISRPGERWYGPIPEDMK